MNCRTMPVVAGTADILLIVGLVWKNDTSYEMNSMKAIDQNKVKTYINAKQQNMPETVIIWGLSVCSGSVYVHRK